MVPPFLDKDSSMIGCDRAHAKDDKAAIEIISEAALIKEKAHFKMRVVSRSTILNKKRTSSVRWRPLIVLVSALALFPIVDLAHKQVNPFPFRFSNGSGPNSGLNGKGMG